MNTGKKSVGLSSGIKGARVSVNSKGRVGLNLGIPGTNFRYRKVMSAKKGGGGFIAAIINLTWWLMVAMVWLCCMICLYFWKFLVFLGKKLFSLIKTVIENFQQKRMNKEG